MPFAEGALLARALFATAFVWDELAAFVLPFVRATVVLLRIVLSVALIRSALSGIVCFGPNRYAFKKACAALSRYE
ncbi:hypothetical protein Rhe02_97970 [Rhizocola hellebori]|uniref:Uncharacterized protein n=1 Tax=Rhizocola hellebori TaxID=1392758 RepID=A0A8J3QIZ3_9ACTN|nr:hypothetical protein Rhe02_97970 [Rhizocola hellebori]